VEDDGTGPPSPRAGKALQPALVPSGADDETPWKGRHLALREAEAILRRSPARLLSVLGPFDAGKTSLLASLFLQIANGQYGTFPFRFASSRTLYGFQDLVARANRWTGKPGHQIVDHTPKEDSKDSGRFLHLGLRPADGADDRHVDMLLSDTAGEWIEAWTRRADEEARSRLAFIPRSDGFAVVVDTFELLGASGQKMDANVGRLIRRIVASAGKRRQRRGIALVFSKFDRVIHEVDPPEDDARMRREAWGRLGKLSPSIWSALEHANAAGFGVAPFAVSAFPTPVRQGQPAGVMAPFTYLMELADCRDRWPLQETRIPEGARSFQAMRRRAPAP
jgi:Double-GTPase 2